MSDGLLAQLHRERITLSSRSTLCALVSIVVSACNGDHAASRTDTARYSTAPRHETRNVSALDSLTAAQIAIRVSREEGVDVPIEVSSFRKDSAGYLLTTSPINPRVAGGETLVRVHTDGSTEVVARYQ